MAKIKTMKLRAKQTGNSGFTLTELLVVLVIIALTSAVVAPRLFPDRSGLEARAGAVSLANLFKQGRKLALATGVSQRVVIDTVTKTAWLDDGSKITFAQNIDIEAKTAEPESAPGLSGVRFFPDGVSTGGEVKITSPRSVYVVSVIWANAEVRLEALK